MCAMTQDFASPTPDGDGRTERTCLVRVLDLGEPGKDNDEFNLSASTGDPEHPYRSGPKHAKIEKGNIQAHTK